MLQILTRGGQRLKKPINLMVLGGLLILGIAAWSWWHYVYSSPSRTFDRMLSTMLSTTSVTKYIDQSEGEDQSLTQTTQLINTPVHQVQGRNIIKQDNTTVTTENIGTPTTDYVRYTGIETTQKNLEGKDFDFGTVLNIWGKSATNELGTGAQLYNQNIFGPIPIGNVAGSQRRALLTEIRQNNIYKVDYGKLKREIKNGRPTFVYSVSVEPVPYVQMLKNFARALGVTQLEDVDPNQYKNTPLLTFELVVDVWSGQLREIRYTDSGRVEHYGSYGARSMQAEPTSTIPIVELQTRLQALQ